jgi:hypothetical protein
VDLWVIGYLVGFFFCVSCDWFGVVVLGLEEHFSERKEIPPAQRSIACTDFYIVHFAHGV